MARRFGVRALCARTSARMPCVLVPVVGDRILVTPAEIADQLATEARANGAYPTVAAIGARYGLDERQSGRILVLVRARWRPLLPPPEDPAPEPSADPTPEPTVPSDKP